MRIDKYRHPTKAYKERQQSKGKPKNGKSTEQKKSTVDWKKEIEGVPAPVFYQSKEAKRCYCCGSDKHLLPQCPEKSKRDPKTWAYTKFNGMQDAFLTQFYQHELIEAHRKSVDPKYTEREFVFQQSHDYGCPPIGGPPPPVVQHQLQQVPSYVPGPSWDNQSHRSVQPPPSYATAGTQEQHAQQHSIVACTLRFQTRPHFFQTVINYYPMAQHAQFAGVTDMLPLGQVHSQVTVAEEDNVVYMDSGSTVKTLRNPLLFQNMYTSPRPIKMATNAGESILDRAGETPIGVAYYNESGIANINSLSLVADECVAAGDGSYLFMDTRSDDAIYHVKPSGTIRYGRTSNGLYGVTLENGRDTSLVQTVMGNIEGHPKRKIKSAMKAMTMRINLLYPSVADFKGIVRANQLRDCPVTVKDIELAEELFGPNLAELKGKNTRRRPPPVVDDIHAVPAALVEPHRKIPAAIDTFWISGLQFLAWIDMVIRYRMAPYLKNKSHKTFYAAIDKCLRYYNHNNFWIDTIHCDREFEGMFAEVKDTWGIHLNMSAAQEHCHPAERNVRAIKDRVRAVWHSLPFIIMPSVLIIEMVQAVVRKMNLFPAKEGISDTYSTQQIMDGRVTDYTRDASFAFGSFCLASNEPQPSNTMEARGFEALALDTLWNLQSGYRVLDLQTWEVVTRAHITVLPMPQSVVDRVVAKGKADGHKPLKFHKRDRVEFLPTGLPAGVAGDTQGYESLLAMIEDDDDESVWSQESDDDEEVPGLAPRQNNRGEEIDSDSDSDDEDSDDEDEDDDDFFGINTGTATPRVEPPHVETVTEDTGPTGVPQDGNVEPPPKASKLPRVGIRRSARVAAMKGLFQELKSVVESWRNPHKEVSSKRSNFGRTSKHKRWSERDQNHFDTKRQLMYKLADDWEVTHNIPTQMFTMEDKENVQLYDYDCATVMATFITEMNNRMSLMSQYESVFAQQHLLPRGLKIWGERARQAAYKEMDQLHGRNVFKPVHKQDLSDGEIRHAQGTLLYVTEKRDGTIKGRAVYNGAKTRDWLSKEDTRSPTVSLEGLMLTMCVDAKEGRDVLTADIPNAFVQTDMPEPDPGEERVIMKVEGVLAEMLVEIAPETYSEFLVRNDVSTFGEHEKKKKRQMTYVSTQHEPP